MTRSEVREAAFLILFQAELGNGDMEEIVNADVESFDMEVNSRSLDTVHGVMEKQEDIDKIISTYSNNWAIARIPKINLVLLRMALYEMVFDDDVPPRVALNEALELAKDYGEDKDAVFINGILGKYYKENIHE